MTWPVYCNCNHNYLFGNSPLKNTLKSSCLPGGGFIEVYLNLYTFPQTKKKPHHEYESTTSDIHTLSNPDPCYNALHAWSCNNGWFPDVQDMKMRASCLHTQPRPSQSFHDQMAQENIQAHVWEHTALINPASLPAEPTHSKHFSSLLKKVPFGPTEAHKVSLESWEHELWMQLFSKYNRNLIPQSLTTKNIKIITIKIA